MLELPAPHRASSAGLATADAAIAFDSGRASRQECVMTTSADSPPDMAYAIDEAAAVLRMRWRGAVSRDDVGRFWTRMLEDPAALAVGRHLDDVRDCRFTFSGNEWLELVKAFLVPAPPHAPWKAAFIVNSSEIYGVLRQFIAYAGELVEAEIFGDAASAEAWLLADGDAPRD